MGDDPPYSVFVVLQHTSVFDIFDLMSPTTKYYALDNACSVCKHLGAKVSECLSRQASKEGQGEGVSEGRAGARAD